MSPRGGYRRTGTLGRKWTSKVRRLPNGLQGVLGNNTGYATYVQAPFGETGGQQRFHRASRWRTIDQAVLQKQNVINRIWGREINEVLHG